ncbi:MAG: phosphotransferase [Candidatus Gracilibacteria bacterium]|nr:phosphotransferase [Candidatus Gracilibacteria bacterium]
MNNNFNLTSEIDINNLNKIIIPVINKFFNTELKSIKRFETGSCHFVYDIFLETGDNIVFRIGYFLSNKDKIEGSIYWYKYLYDLGIKVPKLLYADSSCNEYEKPFTVSERLKGDDIGNMIDSLTDENLDSIAKEIIQIQEKISTINIGNGFGEATNHEDYNLKSNWKDFISEKIDSVKINLIKANVFDASYITKVEEVIKKYDGYLGKVKPIPFFDDITSKNIIVENGKLSGVVDFDTMTFGDRLYWLGLCNMAFIFLNREYYIVCLIRYLNLTKDDITIMNLYTLIFCVDFMSEIGQKFNKDEIIIDENKVIRYKELFTKLYNNIT